MALRDIVVHVRIAFCIETAAIETLFTSSHFERRGPRMLVCFEDLVYLPNVTAHPCIRSRAHLSQDV
jgi:hypothetical protein